MPRVRVKLLVSLVLLLPVLWVPCWAQPPGNPGEAVAPEAPSPSFVAPPSPTPPAPVRFEGKTLFHIHSHLGPLTPQERAHAIEKRLKRLAEDPFAPMEAIAILEGEGATEILSGETLIMTVTEADAQAGGRARKSLAKDYAASIQHAVAQTKETADLLSILLGLLFTLVATGLLIGVFKALGRLFPRLYAQLEAWRSSRIPALKIYKSDLLSADRITDLLLGLAKAVRIAVFLLLLYLYSWSVFYFLPWTRSFAVALFEYLLAAVHLTDRIKDILVAALWGTFLSLIATLLLAAALRVFHHLFPRIYAQLRAWKGTNIKSLKVQSVEVLSADRITKLLIETTKVVRGVLVALLLYLYTTSVLGFFPWTQGVSSELFAYILAPFAAILGAFAKNIPDLISILVIIFVTRYVIKLIRLIFGGIERGAITFPGFYKEWAEPTYKIVRFLVIAFAAIAIFPYIPGSSSPAFRAIGVFLGVLFSLGSSGAVSNIVSGVFLTYMRPFQVGDRVKIADTVGDIVERTLLVTRVKTIKNVHVTIPNAMVLGSHIVNYSATAKDPGLILHTSVTIGYDVSWKKVHELLLAAAQATPLLLDTPAPFVWQTSLNDFYVTYELNVYTDEPNLMGAILSELHQNILDKFHEAGVEIMSPQYSQIRDGNRVAIPEEYLPKSYTPPSFRIAQTGPPAARPSEELSATRQDQG